jgi:hypothetical protein
MKRKFTTKISSIIAMVFVFMLSSGLGRAADLSGTYQVGASQTLKNLTDIAAQLNAGNLTGNVIYELNADYAGGETFPVTFTQFTQTDVAFTATIRLKSGAGAKTTSGADTGTDPANPIPLIKFNGVDNLIFDGREGGAGTTIADNKWTITNTNNKGTTFMFVNDAIGNTLKYCNIQGRNYSYVSGTIVFGGTTGTVGNDNNTIDHCAIYDGTSKPNTAIYSKGQSSTLANSENTISNNYIYNFTALYSNTTTCGINLNASSSVWTITGNSIYQTSANAAQTVTFTFFGIRVSGVYGHTITGNYIGGSLPNCGGAAWTGGGGTIGDNRFNGIYLSVYNSALLDSYVQNNTISNFDWTNKGGGTAPSEGSFCAINISGVGGQGIVHVESNTIGGDANNTKLNSNTNTQTLTGIFLYGTTLYASSNTISGLTNSTGEDIGTAVQGIANASGSTGTYNIYGNKICGLNLVSPSATAGIRGINFLSGTAKINNNDISLGFSDCGSTPITDGVAMTGIYVVAHNAGSSVFFNTVKIGGSGVTGSLDTYAFRSDEATTNTRYIRNNIFFTDRSNASGTGKHYAVRVASTAIYIDYNDYYATGTGAVLGYNGADIASLAAWRTSTGQDAYSINVDPAFNSGTSIPTDPALISGTIGTGITTDFNGATRATPPTIGAYELPAAIWKGATSTDWNTASNWSPAAVPLSTEDVVIPSTANKPVINQASATPAVCKTLTIASGATLTIAPGKALTVTGALTNNATAGLVFQSDAAGTGSLIAGSVAGTGTATAQRWMSAGAWHMVSAPATGQTVADFLTANTNIPTIVSDRGMMDYDPANNIWNNFFTDGLSNGSLSEGRGFSMRVDASDAALTFTGSLQAGSVPVTGLTADFWNCIGNPYTSAIGINSNSSSTAKFLQVNVTDAANIDPNYGAIYVWDKTDNDLNQTYTTYSNASPAFEVQQGQAFFVKMNTSATLVSFTSAMQVHNGLLALKSAELPWPIIKLATSMDSKKSETVIAFNSAMTNGLDPTYDAGLFKGGSDLVVYSRLVEDNGIPFAIQALPASYNSVVIPVGVDSKTGGDVVFSVQSLNLPTECKVILEDKVSKTFTDLSKNTYTVSLQANSSVADRFQIHTSSLTTGINPISGGNLSAFANRNTEIRVNGEVSKNAVATLYDIQGRVVLVKTMEEGISNVIQTPNLKAGIYLLFVKDNQKVQRFKLSVNE